MPNRGQVNKNSFHSDTVRIGRSEEWGTELRGVAGVKVGGRSYAHRQKGNLRPDEREISVRTKRLDENEP